MRMWAFTSTSRRAVATVRMTGGSVELATAEGLGRGSAASPIGVTSPRREGRARSSLLACPDQGPGLGAPPAAELRRGESSGARRYRGRPGVYSLDLRPRFHPTFVGTSTFFGASKFVFPRILFKAATKLRARSRNP